MMGYVLPKSFDITTALSMPDEATNLFHALCYIGHGALI